MNNPNSKSLNLYNQGRSAMDSLDFTTAVEKFRESSELNAHFKTFELLGECYLKQNTFDMAISSLNTSINLGEKNSRAYLLLAKVFLKTGQNQEAVNNLKKALIINPGYETAKALLEKIILK